MYKANQHQLECSRNVGRFFWTDFSQISAQKQAKTPIWIWWFCLKSLWTDSVLNLLSWWTQDFCKLLVSIFCCTFVSLILLFQSISPFLSTCRVLFLHDRTRFIRTTHAFLFIVGNLPGFQPVFWDQQQPQHFCWKSGQLVKIAGGP